ncbi:hypothetical protein GQ42DRAFT_160906 [Ramicandelaber brevisporus]|nr:hypothetical protein GQ42DRAFT_160906 [Ramicandelaber brevisporus]
MPQQQQPQQLQQPDSLQQVDAANITTSSTAFNSMEDDYLAASMKSGTKRFGNRRQ